MEQFGYIALGLSLALNVWLLVRHKRYRQRETDAKRISGALARRYTSQYQDHEQ